MNKTELKTSGIILRIVDFKESDLIFDLFSESGEVISFFARSAKKPKSKLHGVISIGNFVKINYSIGKNLNYPKEISYDLKRIFKFQTKSIEAMYFYADILGIIRLISKDFHEAELFTLMLNTLNNAEKRLKEDLIPIYNKFLKDILDLLGIESDIKCYTTGEKVRDKEFFYHSDSNKVFSEKSKPLALDLPLIKYDEVFEKNFLQKLFYESLDTRVRLKF